MVMPPRDAPQGARFSHVYRDRGEAADDSPRMRRRLAALIDLHPNTIRVALAEFVTAQLGVEVPWVGGYRVFPTFLRECRLDDALDFITVVFQFFTSRHMINAASDWVRDVRVVLRDENVHYTVDDRGGVHYAVDEEFARNKAATIAALQANRYENALHAFEGGMTALSSIPIDCKGAIRGVFLSAEGLFRLIAPNAPRLGTTELGALEPLIQRLYGQDRAALPSTLKMLSSLKDWVEAAHFYRHEQGAQQVAQPPLHLTVYVVSAGASHIRWLAELDAQLQVAQRP
jgi:hypothetical protein